MNEKKIRDDMCEYWYQRGKEDAIQDMIELSDQIEVQEPDGGTRQWMAFKKFRNTMRDRIK